MTELGVLKDTHNRTIRDLRISITDRCNFRCAYCLPDTEESANLFHFKKGICQLKENFEPQNQLNLPQND